MKKIASKTLCWVLICAMLLAQILIPMPLQAEAAVSLRPADTDIQNGTTLHCWNWSYANIIANLPTIAAQGFTSIQVSPIQQAKQPTMGGPVNDWWAFYQPADFAIDNTGVNAMGTKADFMNLCETAHEYGIYVIVDVVANHMAADYNYSRSPAIIADIRNDNSCWHGKNSNINNYSSRENITQYDLDSVLDLNTGSDKVQGYVLNYLKELIDAGADGFRFDAVKHIETPDDNANIASDFWPTVVYGAEEYAESKGLDLYCYGELLDHPDDVNGLPDSAYAKYYSITDNVWGNNVRGMVASGNVSGFGSTYHKNVSADQLVLWAESHDTYAGGNSKGVSEENINKTWALVAARADAMSLYLTRTAGFTPPNELGTAYLSGWVNAEVAAVNKFHKAFVGQSEYVANSGSIAYVERGTSGVVLVNAGGGSTSVNVTANRMASGTYKDQISGNTFTVSGGKIRGTIGASGIAVVYNVASCSHSSHNIAGLCSNCGASVSHKYSSDVCACGKTKPVTGTCAHTAHRYNGVCRGCGSTVGHSYSNGICTVCGVEKPVDTFAYYLTGFINNSNVNEVNEAYRFKDGKLTITSSTDAWVSVRTYNGIYYQTSPDQQYNDTVTLRNASMSNSNAQMRVPGGKTVTLYLQSNYNGSYTLSYAEGGIVDTPTGNADDYYLVGYINGADHGCEGDSQNLGNYKFTDGKLTATFATDSYVFIKTGDNSKWLLADAYCTDTTCTFSEGKTEKMLVPGGKELTFTLTENANGSVTLSYTENNGGDSGDSGEITTETRTIYVDVSGAGWSKVNVYAWSDKGDATGEWPGSAMTKVEGNIYSFEVPVDATSIIFNNGTSQTGDLTIPTDGKNLYTYSTNTWGTYTTEEEEVTTRTIYVDITGFNWSKVNTYSWNAAGATTGEWPGSAMTKVKTNIYSYEVPTNATHIIFNDGTNQTNDLTIPTDGKDLYNYAQNSWSTYSTECAHSYSSKVTVAASCTQNGLQTYTCSLCGLSYTEIIPATGHSWSFGRCTNCGTVCDHEWNNGTCGICGSNCGHKWSLGVCQVCGISCSHSYVDGACKTCGLTCSHSYANGVCTICGLADPDAQGETFYLVGYINGANYGCEEDAANMGQYKFVNNKLVATFEQDSYVFLKTEGNANWYMSYLYATGTQCTFMNTNTGVTEKMLVPGGVELTFTLKEDGDDRYVLSYTTPQMTCPHTSHNIDGICDLCGLQLVHLFVDGVCACGKVQEVTPPVEYFLFGYINGANYACEEDAENMGEYKFVDGKLIATFTETSYVGVKTTGNADWFMTNGYTGEYGVARLYNTTTLGNPDKLYVPGGVQVEFTLEVNWDKTLTLSYTTSTVEPATQPTIALKYPTLTFEDVILMNVYFAASDLEDVTEMGLLTYTQAVDSADITTANGVIPGYTWSEADGLYYSTTNGIAAKDLGDEIYFAIYAKLADGTYTYTRVVSYSPSKYAYASLSTGSAAMKPIVVAMLNYGAAAQQYFNYKTDALVNANLTSAQKALVESYRSDMIAAVASPSAAKQGALAQNGGYARRYPTVSFEGAFCINYYATPSATPKDGITMYYWNQEDYNANSVLTLNNATNAIKMNGSGTGEYHAAVEGIAAKDLDKGVYVCFVYTSGSTTYYSGVLAYSIGTYCGVQAAGTGTGAALAQATAVYGYYANKLFN